MDNTLENKAKFFAQYWDQTVLMNIGHPFKGDNTPDNWYKKFEHDYLLLKSLSAISDEQAIECCRYKSDLSFFTKKKWEVVRHEHHIILESKRSAHSFSIDLVSGDVEFYNNDELEVTISDTTKDYLRGESFLVPFYDLDKEEILNRGWAVLEQEVRNG
ncbi:hypothetical protein ACFSQ3_14600 [Sphingobacterium corticis]|uniref:CdiI C-terminal domain-containing protein n=1 Tax=Sphingobacterium corticis TaxID=1812823 RepID=A0ABW5NMN5_9SPHI